MQQPEQSADYERAVEHATDALEIYFKVEEPVQTGLHRNWLEGVVRMVLDAALPHIAGYGIHRIGSTGGSEDAHIDGHDVRTCDCAECQRFRYEQAGDGEQSDGDVCE